MQFSMNFLASLVIIQSLVSQTASEPVCEVGKYKSELLGQDDYVFQFIVKKNIPEAQWPKVCGANTSKCGSNGTYFKCVNDSWAEVKCSCPGMICLKTGQFDECSGTVTGQPEPKYEPKAEPKSAPESKSDC